MTDKQAHSRYYLIHTLKKTSIKTNVAKLLALDLSSSTGYALFNEGKLVLYGSFKVDIKDFNVNKDPDKSPHYPQNLIDAALHVAKTIAAVVEEHQVFDIVIENTVRGRNRHTQRLLEFIHYAVWEKIGHLRVRYMDPSEWRKILEIRLSKDDKKNNQLVSKGKKRGKIGKKHLSVRFVNATFNLALKLKDNDIADSIALGWAFIQKTGESNGKQ